MATTVRMTRSRAAPMDADESVETAAAVSVPVIKKTPSKKKKRKAPVAQTARVTRSRTASMDSGDLAPVKRVTRSAHIGKRTKSVSH